VVTVHLPRSLVALFPSCERRCELLPGEATDIAAVIRALEARVPGIADRLTEPGPRIRPHINVFVDGEIVPTSVRSGRRPRCTSSRRCPAADRNS
jgi:sulfur-carrier protein